MVDIQSVEAQRINVILPAYRAILKEAVNTSLANRQR